MTQGRMPYARCALAGVVVALSLSLIDGLARPAPAAAAAAEVKIKSFRFEDIPGARDSFQGFVRSARKSCKENRLVKVLRKRRGDDALLGSTRTVPMAQGTWAFLLEREDPRDGRYYAKVSRKRGCQRAHSTTITVNDDPGA